MLETIRIEYQERIIREINKTQLTKGVKIKRQNGVLQTSSSNKLSESVDNSDNTKKLPTITVRRSHKPDEEGYYHRKISGVGNFKLNNITYYFDQNRGGQELLIQITENVLRVYDQKKVLLGMLDKRTGKKYSYSI